MKNKLNNLVLIGTGVVGSAVLASYKDEEKIKVFDESTQLFTKDSKIINDKNTCVMICVNTPTKYVGEKPFQNPKELLNILNILLYQAFKGTVIIKSTVLYKNIKGYTKTLNIVISPEFLDARTNIKDYKNQKYIVLGGSAYYTKQVEIFYKTHFNYNIPVSDICFDHVTHEEAIQFKYIRNIQSASKVLFWEMVQDITGNASKISQMLKNLPTGENSNISQNGYRGIGQSLDPEEDTFSGCLDKDLNAMIELSSHPLLKAFDDYNKEIIYS